MVFKALEKDPQHRFGSVRTFAQALVAVLDKPSVPTRPVAIKPTTSHTPQLSFEFAARSNGEHWSNEDSLFADQGTLTQHAISRQFCLFVVADGISDRPDGQDASRLAIRAIVAQIMSRLSGNRDLNEEKLRQLLVDGVQAANEAVYQQNADRGSNMGTTMTAVLVIEATVYIANVGDSRAYILRSDQLYQLTTDHSSVAQLIGKGLIEPEEIYTHPQPHQLYRSLGEKPLVEVDAFVQRLQVGDKLLLCSDGLWHSIRSSEIQRLLNIPYPDPLKSATALIQAAQEGGGKDNVSVIVIQVREPIRTSPLLQRRENTSLPITSFLVQRLSLLRTLTNQLGTITNVAISTDGQILISGSWDGTVKIWEVFTGKELRTLTRYSERVSLALSANGRTLVSGCGKIIKMWEISDGR